MLFLLIFQSPIDPFVYLLNVLPLIFVGFVQEFHILFPNFYRSLHFGPSMSLCKFWIAQLIVATVFPYQQKLRVIFPTAHSVQFLYGVILVVISVDY